MKISTRGRYGTRLMMELACNWDKGPVQLKEIAKNQQVSLNYIEHLVAPLVSAGLVKTARGSTGGVWLAKPPKKIKVGEIISLFEGSTAPVECVNDPDICKRSDFSATRDIWADIKKAVDGVLESVTLKDLVERQKNKRQSDSLMYQI